MLMRNLRRCPAVAVSLFSVTSVFASTMAESVTLGRPVARSNVAHKQREGAGFIVRRPLPSGSMEHVGGVFLMLDHMGPIVSAPGEAVGAPDHPHRGFETVTYILNGEMEHLDSQGNTGRLGPGWVQWMTAGRGVVHSEMPSAAFQKTGGTMEGFQLWVNLPAKDKMIAPRYQDVPPERIPTARADHWKNSESSVKVVAGAFNGTAAVIDTHTPIAYLDIRLGAGDWISQPIPREQVGFAYVYSGQGLFGRDATPAKESTMVTIGEPATSASSADDGSSGDASTHFRIAAPSDSHLKCLLIYGQPINEPIARYGPFVMNTREELMQAFQDYDSGKMGAIQGAEERYAASEEAKNSQKKSGSWAKGQREL